MTNGKSQNVSVISFSKDGYIKDGVMHLTSVRTQNSFLSDRAVVVPISYYGDGKNFATVHCARVYNRALDEHEIAKNYSIDKKRFGL